MHPGNCLLINLAAVDPAYLILALFLVGLIIIIVIQKRHYLRMEKLMDTIPSIQELKEDLRAIQERLKAMDLDRITGQLAEMRDAHSQLEEKMAMPPPDVPQREPEEAGDVYERIEHHLRSQGFKSVTILVEDPEFPMEPGSEHRLPVEATKEGVVFKGYVVVRDSQILSDRIKPAYEAFP